MKYYESMMSTNMSENVQATMATITSKEAIPKFKVDMIVQGVRV